MYALKTIVNDKKLRYFQKFSQNIDYLDSVEHSIKIEPRFTKLNLNLCLIRPY